MPEFLTDEQRDPDNYTGPSPIPSLVGPTFMEFFNTSPVKSSDTAYTGSYSWKLAPNPSVIPFTAMTLKFLAQPSRRRDAPSDPNESAQFCAKEGATYTLRNRFLYSGSEVVRVQTFVLDDWDGVTPGFVDLSDVRTQDVTSADGWVTHSFTIGPCSPGTASIRMNTRIQVLFPRTQFFGSWYLDDASIDGPDSCPRISGWYLGSVTF